MEMIQQSLFRLSKRVKERKKPPNSKTFKNNTKDGKKRNAKKVYQNSNPFPPNLCRILFTDVKHDRQEQFIFFRESDYAKYNYDFFVII